MRDDNPRNPGRRRFLVRASKLGAAAAGMSFLPISIQKALAVPAARERGTIDDVQHVVILMQENRSFDHYFGTMAGVRGFGDRTAITLPSGKPVWYERDGDREILPFHLDTKTTTAMRVPGTPHAWADAQQAWDQGRFGQWPRFKQFQSMGYYQPDDIPFQRALAEAFTIGDAHHCSIQTGTLANRVVFMTGTNVKPGIDTPASSQDEVLIDNANNRGKKFGLYDWTTYPERLQAAGVSWRIYQDPADNWGGLLAPWESFEQFQRAQPGEPLFENAMNAWSLCDLADHVSNGTLPQVSWILPTPVWSEHPSESSPLQGASYTQQVLDILVSNPAVWSKTVFIVTFDENDGYFDHVPPPAVPSYNPDGSLAGKSTIESLGGYYYDSEIDGVRALRPYGMGPRVPLYVVSPWSKGGWVVSEVFDHTSTIRFLEARFGVHEPNISAWHRAVSGDLTSCFDFAHPDDAELPELPDMSHARGDTLTLTGPPVALPAEQQLPVQASGMRYSRALPYALHVRSRQLQRSARLELTFENSGRAGAVFHVYDRLHLDRLPRRYTVEAGKSLVDSWNASDDAGGYQLQVIGPNGFLREFSGKLPSARAGALDEPAPEVQLDCDAARDSLELLAWNGGNLRCELRATNAYAVDHAFRLELWPRGLARKRWSIEENGNWYDFTLSCEALPGWSRRFAGRLENGRDGVSDPALGLPDPASS
jgi:phospholipase C